MPNCSPPAWVDRAGLTNLNSANNAAEKAAKLVSVVAVSSETINRPTLHYLFWNLDMVLAYFDLSED